MARWDRPNIPHKGWTEIGMEDLGEEVEPGEEIKYEQCEMCGNERIRYVHILSHPKYPGEIHVGCDCAERMTEDYVNPDKNERNLRNRVNRKRNFMKQLWHINPRTGNYVLRYNHAKPVWIWMGVIYANKSYWQYNGRKINDLHTAKLVAFNFFDENHESRGQAQPYWEDGRWLYR